MPHIPNVPSLRTVTVTLLLLVTSCVPGPDRTPSDSVVSEVLGTAKRSMARVCGDGSQLTCRRAIPFCPKGQTAEIVNHCYGRCVDELTCKLVCGDGSQLTCRRAIPICPKGQTAEIVNGCYGRCVDEFTCIAPFCGDGTCAKDESRAKCPEDCGPTFDRIDWIIQDRVTADPSLDPYCVASSQRQEQDAFTPLHFIRLDHAGRQNFTSFKVRAFHDQDHWTDRAITTFDFPPYLQSRRLATGNFGVSGGDTMESEGPLVSIVGTNDSNGTTGWFNNTGAHSCSYGDAWVLYDKTAVPVSPGARQVTWSSELQTPIRGVTQPSTANCPNATGVSRTWWTYYPDFSFVAPSTCVGEEAPHKRIDTIVTDHGPGNLTHHEIFYLTDEYGFTRWERWNCSAERQLAPPSPDYAAMRCDYENSESVMHMSYPVPQAPEQGWQILNRAGLYCVLTDCRDATLLQPIEDPVGWLPAGWPAGSQVYYATNLLRDGDLTWSDPGGLSSVWSTQGTMNAAAAANTDANHYVRLQTTALGRGWLSQIASTDEFRSALGAGVGGAGPLRVRFGLRAKLESQGQRQLQVAVVQWNADLTQHYGTHVETIDLTSDFQILTGETPLLSGTRKVQIRLSLGANNAAPAAWADDIFVLISDTKRAITTK